MSSLHPTPPIVLAAVAHPDDIEFLFAGTLLLLKDAGCEIHMWNLANGCLGSITHASEELATIRWQESLESAQLAGATMHPALFDDLAVFYDKPSLAGVSSVIRSIRPQLILTHSLNDYMDDHQNVARLIAAAAFSRSMPGFKTLPAQDPYRDPLRIYHAAPHGLRDSIETPFQPNLLVDIATVLDRKQEMLSCHRSQKDWLEASQGMGAYISEMVTMSRAQASIGHRIEFAEGWRRHSHLGFCSPDFDPLPQLLSATSQAIQV